MGIAENNGIEHIRYSFRTYVMAGFAIVAAGTAFSIIAIVATVFGIYFATYAEEGTKSKAIMAANVISNEYGYRHSLEGCNYDALMEGLDLIEGEGLTVINGDGEKVYRAYQAPLDDSSSEAENGSDSAQPDETTSRSTIKASIVHDGDVIGEVRIWSDTLQLTTNLDAAFRDETYRALIVAAIVATVIAVCFGLFFSRILTAPINQIAKTAQEISRGNLSARTGITGDNEIANLGETFDNMAASIERDRHHEKRLTSDVAHELRTPLMAIQASVEAMIDGVYDRDDEHLELVDDEVKRLSRMVDALLQLSRLENRSKPVHLQANDLGALARQEVAAHEVLVKESGKTINLHDAGDVWAMCDKDMIRQAVANLISNANRYTDAGGRIDVTVREDGKWAELIVSDTGIGLDPEEEKMVFERFWRADSGRGRNSGGLGVGLSVVREIVTQNGGRISVKGVKGHGSTFVIQLPDCSAPRE